MSTAHVILTELRQGERTTSELIAATGATRNACLCALSGLNTSGYTIANVTGGELRAASGRLFDLSGCRGGHSDARWRLVWDPEHPTVRTCAWPGCSVELNRYNPSTYCLAHRRSLALLFIEALDARLAPKGVTADHEQLALVR